ncbi:hypothetical protein [Candidatus Gillettellia adelgis]
MPDAVAQQSLCDVIRILDKNLTTKFNPFTTDLRLWTLLQTKRKRLYGTRKIDSILLVCEPLRSNGVHLNNPLLTHTLFQPKYLKNT